MTKQFTLYSLHSHQKIHPERHIVIEHDTADMEWWSEYATMKVVQSCSAASWEEAHERMTEDQWL